MDAFLAKPIRPRKLQELLAQFASKRPAGITARSGSEHGTNATRTSELDATSSPPATSNSTIGTRLSDLLERSDGGATNDVVDFAPQLAAFPED